MARRKNMQRRREILDNTFRLIRANGFDNVSLQMIAENSGISKSLLQSYYPHKARLMTDIVRNFFNTMWDQVEINYHAPKKNPFTRVDALIYTIATLGMADKGLDRVITEAFTDQTSLDNWSWMLDEWMKSHNAFSEYSNYQEIRTGIAFIITGVGRLYRDRGKHGLNAEQMADYSTSSLMYGFLHADLVEIDVVLEEGHRIIDDINIGEVHHAIDTMFDEGKVIYS
ncbi:TetR/AcrR family transcriptional regulator [Lactobacillus delbrueckii]|uniref:TetR/AcrR family transcriptional regulator n=1 Tax=Lactobacillus delbrueckii TaxID=1584 RepID=UPI0021A872BC|nr:TetR/AcrR family transcriptional regulator [Lactobacillus delbrueckii]MCT3474145.1 TetR/AcrR family transcriptional regulator [Lactobacillus delbrueckii subsp. bulgaricus]